MSSSDSLSSQSSFEPSSTSVATRHPYPSQQIPPRASSNASSNRPLPDLPHHSTSDPSEHMLSSILRDRPLPNPEEQTVEERRRSLIALDRKKRLTNPDYGDSRRRSNHSTFHERRLAQDHRHSEGSSASSTRSRASSTTAGPPEVIDLTASSPPPHRETGQGNRLARIPSDRSRQYLVPRWQPDSEVNECPICHRPFTWMFRRHHCRKCGRVVCNECSPHRITIPRQYIVNPPGPEIPTSPTIGRGDPIDLTQDDDNNGRSRSISSPGFYGASGITLEGGEKVRLCNPCVPDPQPEPPLYYSGGSGSASRDPRWNNGLVQGFNSSYMARSGHRQSASHSGAFEGPLTTASPRDDLVRYHGQRPVANRHTHHGNVDNSQFGAGWFGSVLGPTRSRSATSGSSPVPHHPTDDSRHPQSQGPSLTMIRPSHNANRQPRDEYTSIAASMPNRSRGMSLLDDHNTTAQRPRPSQNPFIMSSRPRLAEIDICPVCRRALPPRGPGGDESAREAHIVECLQARDPTYHGEGSPGGPSQTRIHMLPFIATEKDCVGHDGSGQECSICMVEYDVGDELARLECLCKFHKECIVEWLGRKPECPLHKLLG